MGYSSLSIYISQVRVKKLPINYEIINKNKKFINFYFLF